MRGMAVQNDTHELDTIHALATNMVGEPTEENLTDESTDRGRDLETEVLVGRVGATLVVDVADHGCDDGDREDVVGIGEEADTGDNAGLGVEPRELGLVDLDKGGASALASIGSSGGERLVNFGRHDGRERMDGVARANCLKDKNC
jgi:hypothetical protein